MELRLLHPRPKHRSGFGVLLALLAGTTPAGAQQTQQGPLVRWPEALGVIALTGLVATKDGAIRRTVQGHPTKLRNAVAVFGNQLGSPRVEFPAMMLMTVGGYAFGSRRMEGAGRRALEALAIGTVTTMTIKSLVGRRRPEVSPDNPYRFHPVSVKYNSFPSGHATIAFALATSLAMESKSDWMDVGLYTLAATTVFARLHVDKHWASDMIAGAAVGIVAARWAHRRDRFGTAQTDAGVPLLAIRLTF